MTNNDKIVSVHITFRNTEATDALKSYANDKIGNCVKKFVRQDTEVKLVLQVEQKRQIAEISLHSQGHDFKCTEETEDMYKSIDKLSSALSEQLRRHKERLTQHH